MNYKGHYSYQSSDLPVRTGLLTQILKIEIIAQLEYKPKLTSRKNQEFVLMGKIDSSQLSRRIIPRYTGWSILFEPKP